MIALCALCTASAATTARAWASEAEKVHLVILRENGLGSASTAQQYVDKLMGRVAELNGWSAAHGKYVTSRDAAKKHIDETKPKFGFFSLAAFIGMKADLGLQPLGTASIEGGGGEQYYVVSKSATDLAGCQGKTLATNHAEDASFINEVVFDGAAKLSDFEVVPQRRPLQPVKAVLRGEAECALLDDAQMAELGRKEGGTEVKALWFSRKLPAIVVAAFPSAKGKPAKAFANTFPDVCKGPGAQVCKEAGIKSLTKASGKLY